MLNFNIPGRRNLKIDKIIFDLNGTIACDGSLIDGVEEGINSLAEDFKIYILTADTFGTAEKMLKNLKAELVIIDRDNGSRFKADFVEKLGRKRVIAVGNGNNVAQMLKKSVSVFKGSTEYLKDELTPVASAAASDLIQRAEKCSADEPLYVVAIGVITNIASAIIMELEIIKKLSLSG